MMDILGKAMHLLGRTEASESGCLEFSGCVQANGYSRATINRKTDYAHRHIFRLLLGEIPKGFDVCHSCDNRKCINPNHLFIGTREDNMRDAVKKGRTARGLSLPQAKLSEQDKDKIVALAKARLTYKEIAKQFGVCSQRAGQIAIRNGVRKNVVS